MRMCVLVLSLPYSVEWSPVQAMNSTRIHRTCTQHQWQPQDNNTQTHIIIYYTMLTCIIHSVKQPLWSAILTVTTPCLHRKFMFVWLTRRSWCQVRRLCYSRTTIKGLLLHTISRDKCTVGLNRREVKPKSDILPNGGNARKKSDEYIHTYYTISKKQLRDFAVRPAPLPEVGFWQEARCPLEDNNTARRTTLKDRKLKKLVRFTNFTDTACDPHCFQFQLWSLNPREASNNLGLASTKVCNANRVIVSAQEGLRCANSCSRVQLKHL